MTREEAIKWFRESPFYHKDHEPFNLAIKALEQEPRKDEVILTNKEYRELISNEYDHGYCKGYAEALQEQEPILDKIRAEITTLQNRCYALTKGTMCAFCKYECEYKAETEDT